MSEPNTSALYRRVLECLDKELNLGYNRTGDAGAADLAKALASGQCGLTTLDLLCESAPR